MAEARLDRTAVAPNIIASASKIESLLFKASLLHFGAIARDTLAGVRIWCIPQLDYFLFDPASKILRGGTGVQPSK
jgi:hypothetical protein